MRSLIILSHSDAKSKRKALQWLWQHLLHSRHRIYGCSFTSNPLSQSKIQKKKKKNIWSVELKYVAKTRCWNFWTGPVLTCTGATFAHYNFFDVQPPVQGRSHTAECLWMGLFRWRCSVGKNAMFNLKIIRLANSVPRGNCIRSTYYQDQCICAALVRKKPHYLSTRKTTLLCGFLSNEDTSPDEGQWHVRITLNYPICVLERIMCCVALSLCTQ